MQKKRLANYGKILKMKEKDNPSSFCRGSYLVSNAGNLMKCYGRALRFPQDRDAYLAFMKVEVGDVLMQTELIEIEHGIEHHHSTGDQLFLDVEMCITSIVGMASLLCDLITVEVGNDYRLLGLEEWTKPQLTRDMFDICNNLCQCLDWDYPEIEHLGFIHTCERFDQFAQEGWPSVKTIGRQNFGGDRGLCRFCWGVSSYIVWRGGTRTLKYLERRE